MVSDAERQVHQRTKPENDEWEDVHTNGLDVREHICQSCCRERAGRNHSPGVDAFVVYAEKAEKGLSVSATHAVSSCYAMETQPLRYLRVAQSKGHLLYASIDSLFLDVIVLSRAYS